MNSEIDHIDRRILDILQADARISMSALSRELGLSQPAVAERVRKLEEANIITGYHARINTAALGLGIQAVVRLGRCNYEKVERYVRKAPEVRSAHNVTGNHGWIIEISVRDVAHLDTVLSDMYEFGETETAIILSTAVREAPFKLAKTKPATTATTYSDDTLRPPKKGRG